MFSKTKAARKSLRLLLRLNRVFWRRGRDSLSPAGSVRVGSDLPPAGHSLPTRSNPAIGKAEQTPCRRLFCLAERKGFEPLCAFAQTDFECCKTLADSRLEQVVPGRIVKSRKPRHRKEFRTFRPVSARGDLKCPRVQIKLRSCVKSRRSCAFARSQARKQRPRQHR